MKQIDPTEERRLVLEDLFFWYNALHGKALCGVRRHARPGAFAFTVAGSHSMGRDK